MDCEQATLLISARLDREITSDDRARLEAHLHTCPECAATAEAFLLQDADLRRTFAPRREAAGALADRVVVQIRKDQSRRAPPSPEELRRLRRRLAWVGVAAAVVAGVSLYLHARRQVYRHEEATVVIPKTNLDGVEILTARRRPPAPPAAPLNVGDAVETAAGQKRRLALADGTVLYLNQNTAVKLDADRRLTLARGEVFLEVAPRDQQDDAAAFVVQTPRREVAALGTKFAVRADADRTGVVVTQGQVRVSGFDGLVRAGQQLAPDADRVSPAPSAAHALGWTRDLVAAAESPLVPASRFAGGALVAVDADGQEAKLSLRKYLIDVHVEDGFARTTIDQTYFNHTPWRLEGTFYFPLPADASLSRLAMYVDGKLMEGGMAEREYARQVYERIVYSMRDPALLEWVDGTTFKMRVFPLEGRQEKRVILSYVQRLPVAYGRTQYRFPAGHTLQAVDDWQFHALVKNGSGLLASSPSHPGMRIDKQGRDLVLKDAAKNVPVNRDVVLDLDDPEFGTKAGSRFSETEQDGYRYLMVRHRPALPGQPERRRRDWVFLFESSGDRDPLLARVQVDVIRTLLSHAEHDDTFAVVAAGTRAQTFATEPRPATPSNVREAVEFLERSHLVGALDLGRALNAAAPLLRAGDNPYLVHVGSGVPALGERREDVLAKRIPNGVRYVGVGVGKRWARGFMKAAAERSGGHFTQINPDEPVAWRAFELFSTLNAPRLLDVKVEDASGTATFLTMTNAVSQGEAVCAITRVRKDEKAPEKVRITGKLDGRPEECELTVSDVEKDAGYLPRTWARLEIDRLLAEDAEKHKKDIIDLSKAMYVMTPFTSLLVLENEAMYKEFKVDRGRKDHWAMYPCPEVIPVVYEPDPTQPVVVRNALLRVQGQKPHPNEVRQTVVVRQPPQFLAWPEQAGGERGRLWEAGGAVVNVDRRMYFLSEIRSESSLDENRKRIPRGELDDFTLVNSMFFTSDLDAAGGLMRRTWEGKFSSRRQVQDAVSLQDLVEARLRRPVSETPLAKGRTLEAFPYPVDDFISDFGRVPWQRDSHGGTSGKWNNWTMGLRFGVETALNPFPGSIREMFPFPRDPEELPVYFPLSARSRVGQIRITGSEVTRQSIIRRQIPAFRYLDLSDAEDPGQLIFGQGLLLHTRPSFTGDRRLFTDLLAYAPGLNSSAADIEAVLEAEAAPRLSAAPGHIDPAARQLLEQARRAAGWQEITILDRDGAAVLKLSADGAGRFAYERVLSLGLRERVACDGQTLLHLYPELGLGARRTVSRFHRAELNELIPWWLPPADDLARGADVKMLDEQTVAVVPRGAEGALDDDGKPVAYAALHLVFRDGRLAERRLVAMPEGKTLLRETCEPGVVKVFDRDGKELSARKFTVKAAGEPELRPDTSKLVLLPLPLRSRDHVYQALGLETGRSLDEGVNRCFEYLDAESALQLLMAEVIAGNGGNAQKVFLRCFHAEGDRRLGYYTLLAAAGAPVAAMPEFLERAAEYQGEPLARYLALVTSTAYRDAQRKLDLAWGENVGPRDGFLGSLAEFHDLYQRWQYGSHAGLGALGRRAREARAVDFVRRHKASALGLALLTVLQDRAGRDAQTNLALADAWGFFADHADLGYIAKYERARCLLRAGRRDDARRQFQELYAATLKRDVLPPIDATFRAALLGQGGEPDLWNDLMRQTARSLAAGKHRPAVVALAWQCWQLEDRPLADNLLAAAREGAPDEERLPTGLAAFQYLAQTNQYGRALAVVEALLADDKLADLPGLWRLAAAAAGECGKEERSVACLERALDIEFRDLPEVVPLEPVRRDYRRLLEHYDSLAKAAVLLKVGPPRDVLARTVRAADRWRSLDRDGDEPCRLAARVLRALGEKDLAWQYLTTPVGQRPNEAASWLGVARELVREGELKLADRAYAAAFEAEPTNAQVLWARAQNLHQAGREAEAQKLLRQIADGDWQPRFQGVRTQARWQLEGR